MNDLFSKKWVRHSIRFFYALLWTVVLVLSLYYTDIIKSDNIQNIWSKITSSDMLGMELRSNKIILPVLIAMFLFWIDTAYIRLLEANESSKRWKHHLASILVGIFILLAIVIMMVNTFISTAIVVAIFFIVCGCYKFCITPLPPEVDVSNESPWEVSTPHEDPLTNN